MKLIKQINSLIFLLPLLLFGAQTAFAQNWTVSGTVLDMREDPLSGVAVIVEGTSKGVLTINDGSFSMELSQTGSVVLEVSCLGYNTKKVTVSPSQPSGVTVYLEEDITTLDETVVIGYGTQKKVNLTGAVAVVDSKSLENRVSANLSTLLQGTVPGLNITTTSGVPGSSSDINVRGSTSINGGDPLILIDGIPGDIDYVNPEDVESISVIKDASAAAIYGARAAFGVILITTKTGSDEDGKVKIRVSGKWGWEAPTTSTDFETTGYWHVYTINKFYYNYNGSKYIDYTDADMMQLLARVHDKTENPDRPWVITDFRNGRNQWVYYCNTDWWHEMYEDKYATQQYDLSLSGQSKGVRYMVSGQYKFQDGIIKSNSDTWNQYNLRSKLEFDIAKWGVFSNNTSMFISDYFFPANSSVEDTIGYSGRHGISCFPLKNPDGSWVYGTPYIAGDGKVANGRHIVTGAGNHRNTFRTLDFQNTSTLTIKFTPTFSFTGDFSYRTKQTRNTRRSQPFEYREYPDAELSYYSTGAGLDALAETVRTYQYFIADAYFSYDETFGKNHHVSATAGFNYERRYNKDIYVKMENLVSSELDDFDLLGTNDAGETVLNDISGGQSEYVLMGIFVRANYDYKGKYLFEFSGRYDGTSRFAKGHRWGFFPSASIGWRLSEEPFFDPARGVVDNLKVRASFGSLGNQEVSDYSYIRLITVTDFSAFSFGEGSSMARYATLAAPVAGDLTWEIVNQYDVGVDLTMFKNRLDFTGDIYIRNTIGMLTAGIDLPSVYGASSPKMNAADLSTKGYEFSLTWRDHFMLGGRPFEYSVGGSVSNYDSVITKYANDTKLISSTYYNGMHMGEIWGFRGDGIIQNQAELDEYLKLDSSYITYTGGVQIGDFKYKDLNGDGVIDRGANTVSDPGDREIIGNELPRLSFGFNGSIRYFGFDVSVVFQGTGNHYYYPSGYLMNFWGCYGEGFTSYLQKDFLSRCWAEDNTDAYFPRPMRSAATSGSLSVTNDTYLQNLRYLRLKNVTVGYTVPSKLTRKISIDQIRVYFTGENLAYWSPVKKYAKNYMDPEGAFTKSSNSLNSAYYPWSKSFVFGIDISF